METLREQFPQLKETVNGYPLTYLDSAATTLKPRSMIERMNRYLSAEVSNVHRGAHYFSNKATENYENTRLEVASFLQCNPEEVIFTSGTTDSINLVSTSFDHWLSSSEPRLKGRNQILLTEMEHHSNIVPWYNLAKKHNLQIKVIPFNSEGELDLLSLEDLINNNTLIVSMVHMSNTLGSVNPIEEIVKRAKEVGSFTFVDAAQSISYMPIDVRGIGCDFLAFSAHKLFGPEGLGFLYGRSDLLDQMPLYKGGGSMISKVSFDEISFLKPPQKYEAGTPNIGAVVAFSESLKFFKSLNYSEIQSHENNLLSYTIDKLNSVSDFKPVGSIKYKKNILSFNIGSLHPSDIGVIIDNMGIAVRVGHHCTQPLFHRMGLNASVRASFSIYNNLEDCDRLVNAIVKAQEMLND